MVHQQTAHTHTYKHTIERLFCSHSGLVSEFVAQFEQKAGKQLFTAYAGLSTPISQLSRYTAVDRCERASGMRNRFTLTGEVFAPFFQRKSIECVWTGRVRFFLLPAFCLLHSPTMSWLEIESNKSFSHRWSCHCSNRCGMLLWKLLFFFALFFLLFRSDASVLFFIHTDAAVEKLR